MHIRDATEPPYFGVRDNTGTVFNPDSCAMTGATYDADGNLLTMTKSDGVNTWVMTYTWDANGNLATVSLWVRQ